MGNKERNLERSMKLIVRASFVIFIGIFLSKLLSYIYRVVIARYYGPEVYGLYLLAIMITTWVSSFALFGLSDGILRFVSYYRGKNDKEKIKYLYNRTARILLITSIISAALLFFLSDFISAQIFNNPNLSIFIKIMSLVIPFALFSNIYLSIIKAFEKIGWYSFIFNILQNVAKVVSLVLLIILGINSNAIILSYILGVFASFFASYLVCKYYFPFIFFKFENGAAKRYVLKDLINYSWPMMFTAIISTFLFSIDTFFIGYLKDASLVGLYNAAVPIAALLYFAPEIFLQLFFPIIMKEYSKNNIEQIRELSKQISKWALLINVPALLIMILFPGAIINLIFGKEYLIAENALRILAIGVFFGSLSNVASNLVSMAGKSKLLLFNIGFAGIVNIILNLFLIKKYGINGAAAATTISYIILTLLLFYESWKYLRIIPLRRKILTIILISIIPLIIVSYLRNIFGNDLLHLILFGILFILIYVILIFIFKGLDKNDAYIASTLLRRAGLGKYSKFFSYD